MVRTRRDVLQGAAGAMVLGLTGLDLVASAAAQPVRIRRNLNRLPPGDRTLEIYRRAVRLMHELPANDRRNWARQAKLHNDNCAHKNWLFLPFHRAYLRYFEHIIRELTGEAEFALPYWDWSESPRLPAAFVGANEPLDPRFWPDPDPNIDGRTHANGRPRQEREIVAGQSIPISRPAFRRVLTLKDFRAFGGGKVRTHRDRGRPGQLESGAHDTVHLSISGHMAYNFSPLDPVFWLHHANIDRLWAEWNQKSRNTNPTDRDWRNYDFRNVFTNRRGQLLASVKVSEVTSLAPLGYTYDTLAGIEIAAASAGPIVHAMRQTRASRPKLRKLEAPVGVAVELGRTTVLSLPLGDFDLDAVLAKSFPSDYEPEADDRRIYLTLAGVTAPTLGDDFFVRVFIGTPGATAQTSDVDLGFVDQFAFFNTAHAGHGDNNALEFSFDIVDTLRNLKAVNRLPSGTLDVQLVPVAFEGRMPDPAGARFSVGSVAAEVR